MITMMRSRHSQAGGGTDRRTTEHAAGHTYTMTSKGSKAIAKLWVKPEASAQLAASHGERAPPAESQESLSLENHSGKSPEVKQKPSAPNLRTGLSCEEGTITLS